VAVKSVRIIRLVLLLALAGYLWLFHAANRQQVELPILNYLLPPIPVAYVLAFALVAGWAVGFVPTRLSLWRRSREVKKLRERVAELEAVSAGPPVSRTSVTSPRRATHSPYSEHETELPVIPDRGDPYPGETTSDDEAG
jgi:hypothetical protein